MMYSEGTCNCSTWNRLAFITVFSPCRTISLYYQISGNSETDLQYSEIFNKYIFVLYSLPFQGPISNRKMEEKLF